MGSVLYFPKVVILSPVEQRYIASCHHVISYPHHECTLQWKRKLIESAMEGREIKVNTSDLQLAFPGLTYFICTEYLERESPIREPVIQYFRGMGEKSHNGLMYIQVSKALGRASKKPRQEQLEKLIENILSHAHTCTVKLAEISGDRAKVWSIRGVEVCNIDDLFNIKPEGYTLTHGKTDNGLIPIEPAPDELIEQFKQLPELWRGLYER